MLEDRLLVWKFKCVSNEALCRIDKKYGDYLLALATALLNDMGAAEDALHDSFVAFAESAHKIRLEGNLRSFLAPCMEKGAGVFANRGVSFSS